MDAAKACHGVMHCHSLSAWSNNDTIVAAFILIILVLVVGVTRR